MEQSVLNTKEVRDIVDRQGVRTLRADWSTKDEAIGKLMQALQGSEALPLLAIFPAERPNRPIVLQSFYSLSTLKQKLESAGASAETQITSHDSDQDREVAVLP